LHKHLTKQTIFDILSARFVEGEKKLSHIPNPALLQDGTKAAKRIADSIKNNEKITLIGDYDVDGVSSSAIMVEFFRLIPYPLEVVIPNRFRDGYGVSASVLKRVEADLIITVDNGISAIEAGEICKQRGIDLIITDHHTPPETLPHAIAIVNPKLPTCTYPFKEICGAEVAWLLLALVKKELNLKIDMKEFLDILAIAIIADIMPLVDINRAIVKEGLKTLMTSKRPASIIIRDFLNKGKITSEDIAFQISPRLNSAGRLEDASIALDFLTATDTHQAYLGFEKLNSLNELRKETEANCTKEAIKQANPDAKVIVVANELWHEGVVGIVASRLVEKFGKPAIVLSIKDGIAKGSARSIGEVDIYKLIKANEHLLIKFGGHKMAAGLSLKEDDLQNFTHAINKSASVLNPDEFIPKEITLGILTLEEIDFELLELLEQFEPYGEANPKPSFMLQDAHITNIKLMGKDKSHSKIEVKETPHAIKGVELVAFRRVFEMPQDKKITCSYKVAKNEFNNRVSLQLLVDKIYL
jgi:single-stranded-DNA-specific exonuclease